MSKATIRDVARAAGVSQSTVSRVLNKNGYTSLEVQERVKQAAKDLDYSPSPIAVSLSKSRSRMIGVIVPQIFSPFFSELFYAVDKIAEKYEYRLLLCNSDSNVNRERCLIHDLLSYKVAALFIVPVDDDNENNADYLNSIRQSGVPVICVDREPKGIECDGVYLNNYSGCYEITKQILQWGYRNIAYMADPPIYGPGRQRLEGFEAACQEFGVAVPEENKMFAPIEEREIRKNFLHEIVRRKNPPKVILNFSKGWDAMMMQEVMSTGLRVPEDIFLAGLDDDNALQNYGYNMDYRPGIAEISEAATTLLMDRILHADVIAAPDRKILDTHLSALLQPHIILPPPDIEPTDIGCVL